MKKFLIKFKFQLLSFTLIGHIACQKQEEINLTCIDIQKHRKKIEVTFLNTFTDNIHYVPLSVENGSIVNNIREIDFFDDKILVADNENCFLFNLQGKLISKIGNKGNGPEEYKFLSSCKIVDDDFIYIKDRNYLKFYNYNGSFISKYQLPKIPEEQGIIDYLGLINDTLFIAKIPNYSGSSTHSAIIFSLSGKILKKRKNFTFFNRTENYITESDAKANIYKYNNKMHFKEMLNDTVFRILHDYKFIPVYFFDLGKFKFEAKNSEVSFQERMKIFNNFIFIQDIFETKKYLFLNISMGKNSPEIYPEKANILGQEVLISPPALGIYSKENNRFNFVKPTTNQEELYSSGIMNNVDCGPNFYPKAKMNDSILVSWIDAYKLKSYIQTKTFQNSIPLFPEKKKELEQLAESLNENDNPVLMFVKLKE